MSNFEKLLWVLLIISLGSVGGFIWGSISTQRALLGNYCSYFLDGKYNYIKLDSPMRDLVDETGHICIIDDGVFEIDFMIFE